MFFPFWLQRYEKIDEARRKQTTFVFSCVRNLLNMRVDCQNEVCVFFVQNGYACLQMTVRRNFRHGMAGELHLGRSVKKNLDYSRENWRIPRE